MKDWLKAYVLAKEKNVIRVKVDVDWFGFFLWGTLAVLFILRGLSN